MASIPWVEKEKRIREEHPEALDVTWDSVMRGDSDLFARIIGDVVKSSSGGSRPGKRPTLSRDDAFEKFNQLTGQDFSEYDFYTTFNIMCGKRSVRAIASKTGLGKSYVFKLMRQEAYPSYETMERIAKGFKKDPSFFLEYRIGLVTSIIIEFLEDSPETASAWYLKMRRK